MKRHAYLKLAAGVLIAAVVWFVIFVIKPMNFWLSMSCGIIVLFLTALTFDRRLFRIGRPRLRHIAIGAGSAVLLYGVFYAGNYLAAIVIPAKDTLINAVYMNRAGTNPCIIFVCLLLIIGPGEEFFWRGFIQRALSEKFGPWSVVLAALLYTAVHVVTLNFMLIAAALVCGLFWGFLYYREKNLFPVIVSHALWDVAVFLVLPFN